MVSIDMCIFIPIYHNRGREGEERKLEVCVFVTSTVLNCARLRNCVPW